ncbi:DUF4920 domain-containing protein [Candidatus Contubernalis alkaliaceticus]|uniref:DUF4920 domain-containing protein n=1 Tax=Candidatus Contubernalis alkaliaceticus TaxID=338645 RepID=UPI001F4C3E97|nr:DUF4920 domain-containing protein [Candidatus Contubernalis alkalaceticus]UNC93678.1 DUF4920 domain-containing protein [Candidatus Contubernalis alkalaceticus]
MMSKKMLHLISNALILFVVISLMGCSIGQKKKYGQPIDSESGQLVEIESLFADTQNYQGKNVIVEAKVVQVCQASGCWIIVSEGAEQLFVQFYDFTVTMSAGTPIRVQGEIRIRNQVPYLAGQGLEVLL